MGILSRFMRMCRADLHGVMDQMEDKELLLKHYLREMEEVISVRESRLRQMKADRDQAQKDYKQLGLEIEEIERDIQTALDKDRDDIARFLIKKLKPLPPDRTEMGNHLESLECEIKEFGRGLEQQRREYESLKMKTAGYLRRKERTRWDSFQQERHASVFEPSFDTDMPDEEIELELLRRKEKMKGGTP